MLILLISLLNVKCIEPDTCRIQLPQGLHNRMVLFAWAVYCVVEKWESLICSILGFMKICKTFLSLFCQ